MKLIIKFCVILMNILYAFFKIFPIKNNRIVFISRQSDNPSLDFRILKKELEKDYHLEVIIITKKMKKNVKDILKNINIIIKQMHYLATSKVCVTDGYNIPISVLKHKKELTIIQIWHSLGAIKKFGLQSINTKKQKNIANVLRMHKNYDYIIVGSDEMKKYFSLAFGYDKEKLFSIGLPRLDYLSNYDKINKKKIYSKYPIFKKKKVILYVPTFRDNDDYKINELIAATDLKKYILVVKKHPNMSYEIEKKEGVYTCDDFTSLQLLSVSDHVITDYSAISIEAARLDKPVYLYVYDIDEYKNNPGINLNLDKMLPGYVFKDEKKLYNAISKEKYDMDVISKFKKKYVCNDKGTVTKELAEFIVEKGKIEV